MLTQPIKGQTVPSEADASTVSRLDRSVGSIRTGT